jgi:hypothetical protein
MIRVKEFNKHHFQHNHKMLYSVHFAISGIPEIYLLWKDFNLDKYIVYGV